MGFGFGPHIPKAQCESSLNVSDFPSAPKVRISCSSMISILRARWQRHRPGTQSGNLMTSSLHLFGGPDHQSATPQTGAKTRICRLAVVGELMPGHGSAMARLGLRVHYPRGSKYPRIRYLCLGWFRVIENKYSTWTLRMCRGQQTALETPALIA